MFFKLVGEIAKVSHICICILYCIDVEGRGMSGPQAAAKIGTVFRHVNINFFCVFMLKRYFLKTAGRFRSL